MKVSGGRAGLCGRGGRLSAVQACCRALFLCAAASPAYRRECAGVWMYACVCVCIVVGQPEPGGPSTGAGGGAGAGAGAAASAVRARRADPWFVSGEVDSDEEEMEGGSDQRRATLASLAAGGDANEVVEVQSFEIDPSMVSAGRRACVHVCGALCGGGEPR